MESQGDRGASADPLAEVVVNLVLVKAKNWFDVTRSAGVSENVTEDARLCRGIAKSVKALDFDSSIRRFESFFPCH